MSAYYEDNEWCYRISRERSGAFRRSREALVIHHLVPARFGQTSPDGRALTARLLTAHARFYARHGVLLAPWLFDVVPELRSTSGTCDLIAARLLLELVTAKGEKWIASAWVEGALAPLVDIGRRGTSAEAAIGDPWPGAAGTEAEVVRLRQAVAAQEDALVFLHRRHETLARVEQGGWWQLRGHLLPLLRCYPAVRGAGRAARRSLRWLRHGRPGEAPVRRAQDG
jgi:hypothetical protein